MANALSTTTELINVSMTYERVISRFKPFLAQLRLDQEEARTKAAEAGEKVDPSYEICIGILNRVIRACEKYSNDVWSQMEKEADILPDNIQDLANAIVMASVYDYEAIRSGHDLSYQHITVDEIERFWQDDAPVMTKIDLTAVQEAIDKAAVAFRDVVRKNGAEIVAETKRAKKNHRSNYKGFLTHKCPMCGGSLYSGRKRYSGPWEIKCSGCNLTASYGGEV